MLSRMWHCHSENAVANVIKTLYDNNLRLSKWFANEPWDFAAFLK